MQPRRSLRFKVALVFSALTILLLMAQALGVKALAEAQEERLISALIADDMASVLKSWQSDPTAVPPLDPRLDGHVSTGGHVSVSLPASARNLRDGTHEIIVSGREIHVAIAPFGDTRVYRIYDFSAYEQRFRQVIDALMFGTGVFALLAFWLAFGLSGLLVRQVAGLARQVKALRLGASAALDAGRYDEVEVVELVDAFNDYHGRMAQMIEREKEFTGNVSHELRTPLTAIKTSCELLDHDVSINAKSRVRLRQIERAADTMSDLVNALLLLAREESPADIGPVRLISAIEDALDLVTDTLQARGIQTRIEVDHGLHVEANRSALALVLSNLVDNAVRHTDSGHVRFAYADGWLQIEDTGCGIAPESLPHVFERFYQAGAVHAGAKGFGIGLAIVRKICDRYGWSIQLDSERGKGTRVSLRLPPANRISADFTKS
ncbi:sensor histidine kinase [Paraburkholderia fungorum]|uniref:sensor histidine kinase n=1 Tax=Paraburkholderia fungorum TaxID=134537 RepID=UPI0000277A3A|nr:HAMP domain-containing sensor histidine kinase [Paraburkholderia fungorum]MDE1008129.1 HAMP domain-containing sensor histidine kinase [Paraburkholderia fungorum]PNE56731.1 sensor histidine kinase [Paraburkholderia fungorum]PZR38039.1 MAG: sensor histidine kinase [Paraburkholderia fungorum]USU14565.1 HAMP domain-containing histidine kinase [Paraburkholderia fungorum]USU22513.1 HAMP domain-containing histidine kinase [Paraburkholderia fungorum]